MKQTLKETNGYRKEEMMNTMAMAGSGIMNSNIPQISGSK